MKFCPKCGTQLEDNVTFCSNCGNQFDASVVVSNDPFDHTAEFDAKDISDNKVIAMLPYLMGLLGVIVAALLAKGESQYVSFHIRQALKLNIVSMLVSIVAAVLAFTIIVPIAAGVCAIIILVLQVIAFFQVCGGKAKEPAIIKNLSFLK